MSQPNQTTALALPAHVPAMAAIIDDILDMVARTMPKFRNGKKRSLPSRRSQLESHIVYSRTTAGSLFVASVAFGGQRKAVGWTVSYVQDEDGNPIVDDSGDVQVDGLVPLYDMTIVGKSQLPPPNDPDPNKRVSVDVIPHIICDGCGGLLPYVVIDGDSVRAAKPLMCIFFDEFDPDTDVVKKRVRAVPLGLASPANLARWNEIARRMAVQDPSKRWHTIDPIPHNVGRPTSYLLLKPPGSASMGGVVPCYKSEQSDPTKPDYSIVERLCGKTATLDNRSGPIIIRNGEVMQQYFLLLEGWNSVKLTVWGLPGEIGKLQLDEIDLGEVRVDALTMLGSTLYNAHPGSGPALVGRAIRQPPRELLIAAGIITPDASPETASATIRGMAEILNARVRQQVGDARKAVITALGAAGAENAGKPELAAILGDEPTPALLKAAVEKTEGVCPLCAWMLTRNVVQDLGLAVWDWKCWTLRESRKDLLLELARQNGIELPTDDDGDESGEDPDQSKPAAVSSPPAPQEPLADPVVVEKPKRVRKPRDKKKAEDADATV